MAERLLAARRAGARTDRSSPRDREGSATGDTRLDPAPRSPEVAKGGETAGRARLASWAVDDLDSYDGGHDDLAGDRTSRLSPYLHFGCVSPLEAATAALSAGGSGGEGAARQLCWRDFFLQVLAARPDAAWQDYRSRDREWRTDPELFEAWCEGRTGYPIVDAAMRQLLREGFVHNRGRLVAASFLTKDLRIDWRLGARHFLRWLVDGDVANNNLNWQWTAGTGNNTRPNRIFNPTLQGRRFDPDGGYVRRYVGELAQVRWGVVHDLELPARHRLDYPAPVVDHAEAVKEYARST